MDRRGLLAMWSAPRSRSTAFFRMILERGDLLAVHEPFCSMADHGVAEVDGRDLTSVDQLVTALLGAAGERTVFFKDTTDCVYDEVFKRPDFLGSGRHAFMLRHPREIIPSYAALKPDMTLREVGVEYLYEIHQAVLKAGGEPVVVDSDDFVDRPEQTVRAYCAEVGLPFVADALSWESGERSEWQRSARWHADVSASSTVRRQQRSYDRTVDTDPLLRRFCEHHLPFYEYLWQRRLRVGDVTGSAAHVR